MKRFNFVFCGLLAATLGSAKADETRPVINRALTLNEAIEIGLRESPVVRGAQAEVEMAQAQVQAAKAAKKPQVSATTFLSAGSEGAILTTPAPVMPTNITLLPRGAFAGQNVMLMLPLKTGGRLSALVKQAQAARGASEADKQTVRQDLVLETKNIYRQALLAQEMRRVAEERQKSTTERLRIDRAALEAGRIPQLYVLRDEAEDADAAQNVTDAQRDVDIALIQLRATLGLAPQSQITVADTLSFTPQSAPELNDLLTQAKNQRPELQAAQQRIASAGQNLQATRGSYRPQIAAMAMGDLGVQRSSSMGGAMAGVVIGIPLSTGGLRRAQESEARAAQNRAQAEIERLHLQIEREVQTALTTKQAAEKNIATAEAAQKAAQENYHLAGLRYESGRGTNAEVLDALAALTRAQGNRVRALFDWNNADDQLQRALGTASPMILRISLASPPSPQRSGWGRGLG